MLPTILKRFVIDYGLETGISELICEISESGHCSIKSFLEKTNRGSIGNKKYYTHSNDEKCCNSDNCNHNPHTNNKHNSNDNGNNNTASIDANINYIDIDGDENKLNDNLSDDDSVHNVLNAMHTTLRFPAETDEKGAIEKDHCVYDLDALVQFPFDMTHIFTPRSYTSLFSVKNLLQTPSILLHDLYRDYGTSSLSADWDPIEDIKNKFVSSEVMDIHYQLINKIPVIRNDGSKRKDKSIFVDYSINTDWDSMDSESTLFEDDSSFGNPDTLFEIIENNPKLPSFNDQYLLNTQAQALSKALECYYLGCVLDDIPWQDMVSSRLHSTRAITIKLWNDTAEREWSNEISQCSPAHQQIWNICMNYTREEDLSADEKELMKEIRVSNNTSCNLIDGVSIFLCAI